MRGHPVYISTPLKRAVMGTHERSQLRDGRLMKHFIYGKKEIWFLAKLSLI